MSTRKHMQDVCDRPDVIKAREDYNRYYSGYGKLTRKAGNPSAVGATEITGQRLSEKDANLDMSGLKPIGDKREEHPLYVPYNRHNSKKCTCCKSTKPLSAFGTIRKRNGLVIYQSWCYECRADYRYKTYHDAERLKP